MNTDIVLIAPTPRQLTATIQRALGRANYRCRGGYWELVQRSTENSGKDCLTYGRRGCSISSDS